MKKTEIIETIESLGEQLGTIINEKDFYNFQEIRKIKQDLEMIKGSIEILISENTTFNFYTNTRKIK